MKKVIRTCIIIIGLWVLTGQIVNADEVSRKDELKQEIQEVIQKQIPDNQIIEVNWERTEKYSNYVSFTVVTETDKYFSVNVKYSEFNVDQNNYISELNIQREENGKELINRLNEMKQETQKEIERIFFLIIRSVVAVVCIVIGSFVTYEFVESKNYKKDKERIKK